ncbi:MAG: RDD family protein [Opitutales bacterium]
MTADPAAKPPPGYLVIHTGEGVCFSLELASPIERMLAWLIDQLIIVTVLTVVGALVSIFSILSPGLANGLLLLAGFLITSGYSLLMEAGGNGRTPGKRLLKIRVVDASGLPLAFSQIAVRNLLRFVDGLPLAYLVGGTTMLLSPRLARLGDLAAGTAVCREVRNTLAIPPEILGGKFNSLRQYPRLCAQLQRELTSAEAHLLLEALSRRDELGDIERVRLYDGIAEHLKRAVDFPSELLRGLSSEALLRGCADVLFYSKPPSAKPDTPQSPPAETPAFTP